MNSKKTQVCGTALVTGAARRIGAAIATMLHDAGYDVVIHAHQSLNAAHALAAVLNAKRRDSACVCVADLSLKNAAVDLIQQAIAWRQRLDVLINNASCFIQTPIGAVDEAVWDTLWAVNTKAPFYLSEAAHAALVQSDNGNIINMTDIHAEKPLRDYIAYTQTKAALKLQTESLAREYAPNIRVNAVAPGAIVLPEGDNALDSVQQAHILSKTPLGRWGAPEWVAKAVLDLITNNYMTGQTLRVDGGRSIY